MTSTISAFISAVEKSRVLNVEQKRELLDRPELLPERYRSQIATLLIDFDVRESKRDARVFAHMEEAFKRFAFALDAEGIPDEEKRTLLAKSRKYLDAAVQYAPKS